MKIARLIVLVLGILPLSAIATDAAPVLSDAQKNEISRQQAEQAVAEARSANLKAQNALRAEELSNSVPTTGQDVEALSGAVEGTNELNMALYIAALHSLTQIGPMVCNDLSKRTKLFVTSTDVTEAVMRTKTLDETVAEHRLKVDRVLQEMNELVAAVQSTAAGPATSAVSKEIVAKAASVSGVAAMIDAGVGLTKGVVGLASLFKSEIKFAATPSLLTSAELESTLYCDGKLKLQFVEQNYQALDRSVTAQAARLKDISNLTINLRNSAEKLRLLRADVERQSKQKAPNAKLLIPVLARIDKALSVADALVISGGSFVDAFYVVDPASGIAPLAVAAKYRRLSDLVLVEDYEQVQFTLQRSGGYTMTKKRALFNDKVAYAGGVALRTLVTGKDGVRTHDKVYYAQTGWIPVDLDTAAVIPLTNVAP